jgi:hypothetical protein
VLRVLVFGENRTLVILRGTRLEPCAFLCLRYLAWQIMGSSLGAISRGRGIATPLLADFLDCFKQFFGAGVLGGKGGISAEFTCQVVGGSKRVALEHDAMCR